MIHSKIKTNLFPNEISKMLKFYGLENKLIQNDIRNDPIYSSTGNIDD